MPRINLVYLRTSPQNLGKEVVYYERIKALLEIGTTARLPRDCLLDTGAVLSVFPENQWKGFQNDITWLYVPGSRHSLPDWITKVTGLAAKPIDCGIGKIKLHIVELPIASPTPRRSPEIEIIAKFAHDAGAYPQILLGLGGRAFSQWRLVVESASGAVWLEY
jgi:hypothetical protein